MEVPMVVRSHVNKRAGLPGTAAPAFPQHAARCSTSPLTTWSPGNDHMIVWPMGTGGDPSG
jgi:hypothetical protein